MSEQTSKTRPPVRAVNIPVALWLASLPANALADLARDVIEENGGQRGWTDFLATDNFIPF
jgi:hypothetical protein